jgi:hypothetical protein
MYLNPIEILGLSNASDTNSIDNEIIKKAKRKLFAEIDLSDNGVFEYYGQELTKGNCEKAIDDLTNNDYKEFYLYLAKNKPLNEFLASGKVAIFKNFKQDSIFKLPEFVKFISPYFAPKFDKSLLAAFQNDNAELTKAILNTLTLIAQTDLNLAFKSVSNDIQNKIAEIDEITKDIKNEESSYDEHDIEEVVQLVKEHFPTNTLNCLPQYFQSQILKIAKSINNLSYSILEAFDTTQVPNDLTEYLLTLNIGGLDRPTFENNLKIISKKNNERIEQAKNAPLLKRWASVLLKIRESIKNIESKTISSNVAFQNVKDLFDLNELNSLPSFANEIRTQIGYAVRSLSIAIWNKQSDIKNALSLINLALQINVAFEAKEKFKQDLIDLTEIEKKYQGLLTCGFCAINTPNEKSGLNKMLYLETASYGRSIEYNKIKLKIPRCVKCRTFHILSEILFVISFTSIVYLLIWLFKKPYRSMDFNQIFGLIFLSWFLAKVIIVLFSVKRKIEFANKTNLKKHPVLIDKIKNGWKFQQPTLVPAEMLINFIIRVLNEIDSFFYNISKRLLNLLNVK